MEHRIIKFTVPGPLYAYRRIRDKGRYKPYQQYKNRVLEEAMRAGWKGRIASLKEYPLTLTVHVHWKGTWRRSDLSNILKGIEDACFTQDRFIDVIHAQAFPDSGPERVEVTLEHDWEGSK